MNYLNVSPLDGSGFEVAGELDLLSAPELEAALAEWDGTEPLVLDMAGVSFIDSTGLRLLLQLCLRSAVRPAVIIRNPSASVRHLLKMSMPGGIPELAIESRGADTVLPTS